MQIIMMQILLRFGIIICPFARGRLLSVLHAPHHGVGCSERVGAPGMANGCTIKILVTLMSWAVWQGWGAPTGDGST